MKLAIIGSREFRELSLVRAFVESLPRGTLVISGGAGGVDHAAEAAARHVRLSRMIFEPIAGKESSRWEYVAALIARNKEIACACETMTAFWDGSSNGTRRTMEMVRRLGKPVFVRREDGSVTEWDGKEGR